MDPFAEPKVMTGEADPMTVLRVLPPVDPNEAMGVDEFFAAVVLSVLAGPTLTILYRLIRNRHVSFSEYYYVMNRAGGGSGPRKQGHRRPRSKSKRERVMIHLQTTLSAIACLIFVARTYIQDANIQYTMVCVQLLLSSYFVIDYVRLFLRAQDKLAFFLSMEAIVDELTIAPHIDLLLFHFPYFKAQRIFVLQFVRVLRVAKNLRVMGSNEDLRTSVRGEVISLIVIVLSLIFCAAGFYRDLLIMGGANKPFHEVFMYMTVLILGRPLIPYTTVLTMLTITITVMSAVVLIPLQIANIIKAYQQASTYRLAFKADSNRPHILICGNASHVRLGDFFDEFFMEDYLSTQSVSIVILCPVQPSAQLQAVFQRPRYRGRVHYVCGDTESEADLTLAAADRAKCAIVLAGIAEREVASRRDQENISRIVSLKNYSRRLQVYATLLKESSVKYLQSLPHWNPIMDRAVAIERTQAAILASSVVAPGLNAFLANLMGAKRDLSFKRDLAYPYWIKEYAQGCSQELYQLRLPPKLHGAIFCRLATLIYLQYGIVLLGISRSSVQERESTRLSKSFSGAIPVGLAEESETEEEEDDVESGATDSDDERATGLHFSDYSYGTIIFPRLGKYILNRQDEIFVIAEDEEAISKINQYDQIMFGSATMSQMILDRWLKDPRYVLSNEQILESFLGEYHLNPSGDEDEHQEDDELGPLLSKFTSLRAGMLGTKSTPTETKYHGFTCSCKVTDDGMRYLWNSPGLPLLEEQEFPGGSGAEKKTDGTESSEMTVKYRRRLAGETTEAYTEDEERIGTMNMIRDILYGGNAQHMLRDVQQIISKSDFGSKVVSLERVVAALERNRTPIILVHGRGLGDEMPLVVRFLRPPFMNTNIPIVIMVNKVTQDLVAKFEGHERVYIVQHDTDGSPTPNVRPLLMNAYAILVQSNMAVKVGSDTFGTENDKLLIMRAMSLMRLMQPLQSPSYCPMCNEPLLKADIIDPKLQTYYCRCCTRHWVECPRCHRIDEPVELLQDRTIRCEYEDDPSKGCGIFQYIPTVLMVQMVNSTSSRRFDYIYPTDSSILHAASKAASPEFFLRPMYSSGQITTSFILDAFMNQAFRTPSSLGLIENLIDDPRAYFEQMHALMQHGHPKSRSSSRMSNASRRSLMRLAHDGAGSKDPGPLPKEVRNLRPTNADSDEEASPRESHESLGVEGAASSISLKMPFRTARPFAQTVPDEFVGRTFGELFVEFVLHRRMLPAAIVRSNHKVGERGFLGNRLPYVYTTPTTGAFLRSCDRLLIFGLHRGVHYRGERPYSRTAEETAIRQEQSTSGSNVEAGMSQDNHLPVPQT
eukprot:Clim_evm20s204 gene=Clim_evmTU20s204